jgi:ABC-type Fe3+ transport system substrate-binding protein
LVHFFALLVFISGQKMKTSFSYKAQHLVLSGLLAWLFLAPTRAAENEVVVLSPHWDGIKEETARAFSAWHQKNYGQPATVRWREVGGGTSQMVRFLRSEYQTNPSAGIDVFYGGGVEPFLELEKDDLLTHYDPPADILSQIPPQLNGMEVIDPAHEWFGAAFSAFGILTNERVRQAVGLPEVHTWADLTDPRLAGWISASDPRASGSALQIYEIILQAYGWEKGWAVLMEMSANVRSFLSSSAASAVETGVGDAAYGVAIDTYGEGQAGYYGSENVSFILPEGQTVINPDSIAILKNPPHPELAEHFVEFVLSRDGQLLWMLSKGSPGGATRNVINRMSVQPALYDELAGKTPIQTNPFKMHSDFVYSNELGSKRRAILSVLIASWMIDTHDLLVPAWKALNSSVALSLPDAKRQALLAQLVAPPCTEAELLHLADTDWKDPVKRTALVNHWQSEAMDRYKSVLAQVAAK